MANNTITIKLSFVLLLLSCLDCQQCPESITVDPVFSSFNCKFQYLMGNQTCDFQKCTFNSRNIGWKECLNQCCISTDFQNFDDSIDLILQCQLDNQKKRKWILGLSLGLSFSAIGFIILILICFKNEKCLFYKLRQKMNNPRMEADSNAVKVINELVNNELNDISSYNQVKTEINIKKESSSTSWNLNVTKNTRLMQSKCSICKGPKPQSWLPCDHYFHIDCIGTWLIKYDLCCICNNNLKFIHIFCSQCRQDLKILPIRKFKSLFKRKKNFHCEKCSMVN